MSFPLTLSARALATPHSERGFHDRSAAEASAAVHAARREARRARYEQRRGISDTECARIARELGIL